MTLQVHQDELAPRKERYRVLRNTEGERWITVASFPTLREAEAFSRGVWKGWRLAGRGI